MSHGVDIYISQRISNLGENGRVKGLDKISGTAGFCWFAASWAMRAMLFGEEDGERINP